MNIIVGLCFSNEINFIGFWFNFVFNFVVEFQLNLFIYYWIMGFEIGFLG
jgi:hypothetical protein